VTNLRSWFPLLRSAVAGMPLDSEPSTRKPSASQNDYGSPKAPHPIFSDGAAADVLPLRSPDEIALELMEHQHTLFCERKQRVCTAVGKVQEMEKLKVVFLPESVPASNLIWARSSNIEISSSSSVTMIGSEGQLEYMLQREDIGNYIYVKADNGKTSNPIGPVLAGPPRLKDLHIEVVGGGGFFKQNATGEEQILCFLPGTTLVARAEYIGGYEGDSEYWWLRINGGKREQIGSPRTASSSPDPKFYLVTEEDIGCEFKVKVTPVRSDGAKGEVFTSKSSGLVVASAIDP